MFFKKKGALYPVILAVILFFTTIGISAFSLGGVFSPKKTVYIKFKNPGPLPENMEVYFKGIKIGKITEMEISNDYKNTVLKAVIKKKRL